MGKKWYLLTFILIILILSVNIVYGKTLTDLRPKFIQTTKPGALQGQTINDVIYDNVNNKIYIAMSSIGLVVYDTATNTSKALTDALPQNNKNWTAVSIKSLAFDNDSNLIYLGGQGGQFGFYNITSNTSEDLIGGLPNTWTSTSSFNNLFYVHNSRMVYIVGSISPNAIFGSYNSSSNLTKNLINALPDTNSWTTTTLNSLTLDEANNLLYIVGNNGRFGFYNISNNSSKDLNNTDENTFFGSDDITSIAYDNFTNSTYIVGRNAKFGLYNRTVNITYDLTGTDPGDWVSNTEQIDDIIYDRFHKLIYFAGGSSGTNKLIFGVYNYSSNITSDLNNTDTADWLARNPMVDLTYDTKRNVVYFTTSISGGTGGYFGVYNISTNVSSNLTETGTGPWWGTNNIVSVAVDNVSGMVYFGGSNGEFGRYNSSSANEIKDLRTTDEDNWWNTSSINDLLFDGVGSIYLAGADGKLGRYNISTNVTENITTTESFIGSNDLESLAYDSIKKILYFGGGESQSVAIFGAYNVTANATENLTDTDVGNWFPSRAIKDVTYDPDRNLVFIVGEADGNGAIFGMYNVSLNVTIELRRTNETNNFFGSGGGTQLHTVEYVNTDKLVYVGGDSGAIIFGAYNLTANITYNLEETAYSSNSSNWTGTTNGLLSLSYAGNNVLYMGLDNGLFGYYNLSTNQSKNLSETANNGFLGSSNMVEALAYDANNDKVYLATDGGIPAVHGETNGKLTASITSPSNLANLTKNLLFYLNTSITCTINACGNVSAEIRYSGTAISTTTGTTPYYTNNSNPRSCGANLSSGGTCTLSWQVNATGTVGQSHLLTAFANSTDTTVTNSTSSNVNVTIFQDQDNDTYRDDLDTCPTVYNPSQNDTDGDDIGDVCDIYFNSSAVQDPIEKGGTGGTNATRIHFVIKSIGGSKYLQSTSSQPINVSLINHDNSDALICSNLMDNGNYSIGDILYTSNSCALTTGGNYSMRIAVPSLDSNPFTFYIDPNKLRK